MPITRLITCYNLQEAHIIKGMLENEGIECFLTNENFTSMMPGFNGMLGSGIQVMIDESNFDRATFLIATKDSGEIRCPACNSTNITIRLGKHKIRKILTAILSALVLTPFGNIESTYFCKDCKTEFKK